MHAVGGSCDGIVNAISSSLLILPICLSTFLHALDFCLSLVTYHSSQHSQLV